MRQQLSGGRKVILLMSNLHGLGNAFPIIEEDHKGKFIGEDELTISFTVSPSNRILEHQLQVRLSRSLLTSDDNQTSKTLSFDACFSQISDLPSKFHSSTGLVCVICRATRGLPSGVRKMRACLRPL